MIARTASVRARRMLLGVVLAVVLLGTYRVSLGDDRGGPSSVIDEQIETRVRTEKISLGETVDDATFLRRVTLDLLGRLPTPPEVRRFLSQQEPDKRSRLIAALLADARHLDHFAKTWGALLIPEAESNAQIRYFVPGLEAWLRERRAERAGFDVIVRELLTVRIASPTEGPQVVLRDLKQANPIAFLASKGGEPATIAASCVRLFLGIRLECAQCHNHPFESWTQEQFWEQAAFFAGIERRGRSPFSPLTETADRHEIDIMGQSKRARATYLDGAIAAFDEQPSPRTAFASWLTSTENPRFAKAIVNRVWCQFMGEGLVEPVDDFGVNNPPSHPRILDELASRFAKSGFDLSKLQMDVCHSRAYQRTSRVTDSSQEQPRMFARRAIRPMTGDQFFAAISQAVGYEPKAGRLGAGRDDDPVRRRILDQFSSSGLYAHPETSVSQALALMNGTVVRNATDQRDSPILSKILGETTWTSTQQVDELFLLTLSRFPADEERRALATHLDSGMAAERGERLGDILWALLNTPEFRWNH